MRKKDVKNSVDFDIAMYTLDEGSLNAVISVLFFGNPRVKRSYKNQEYGLHTMPMGAQNFTKTCIKIFP